MPADVTIGKLRGGLCAYWTDASGKRVRHQLAARTREEAEPEAIALYRRVGLPAQDTSIKGIWEAYIADRVGRPIAKTMGYTGKPVLKYFGSFAAHEITTQSCRAYVKSRLKEGRMVGTAWTELNHLRISLSWAATQRLIRQAPHVELPQRPSPKDRYLTRTEIQRLLDVEMEHHTRIAILLMLSTGSRIGALLELTWDRVDFDRNQIDLRKDKTGPRKGRATVPMNIGLREALLEAKRAALSDHVIEWAAGPVTTIRRSFTAACLAAGLEKVSPHVLRHTAAVHMAEAGIPMSEIAQFLGHSSTSVTEKVYARYSPGHLQNAADVIDFTKHRLK